MADRSSGVLRWGNAERRLVYQYLNDGRIDPTQVGSASYLRTIKVKEPVWDRHSNKNFYQNVRRQTAQWEADRPRQGGRRGPNVGFNNAESRGQREEADEAGDIEDDDDDDYDDEGQEVEESEEANRKLVLVFEWLFHSFVLIFFAAGDGGQQRGR